MKQKKRGRPRKITNNLKVDNAIKETRPVSSAIFVEKNNENNKNNKFVIVLKTQNNTYKGKGFSALEALRNIKKPDKITEKAVLTIKKGKLKKEILMYPLRIKRLFYEKFQEIQLKSLLIGLK